MVTRIRKIKRPKAGTRAENLINEDPAVIAARIKRAHQAFTARIQPDMGTLMAGDGGMEAVNEKLLMQSEVFLAEIDGCVNYLNETLN